MHANKDIETPERNTLSPGWAQRHEGNYNNLIKRIDEILRKLDLIERILKEQDP